ncbi:hypothetical protein HPB47_023069 [Ixodes persulcatus]|uniref:Uncharacterized protein n=1 Tax=Ixodes persulcatus TaxID=34615 RepID=A0AC60QA94_IXOPE|nr:hypothetical protein HPB47_023069 [Ixodes persulcatus]
MSGARPIDDRCVITAARPITSTGGARTDKWACEVSRQATHDLAMGSDQETSRSTSDDPCSRCRPHPEVPVRLRLDARGNRVTIDRLATATEHVTGMLRRIRNKRHGLKERDAVRLQVQASAISCITYGTAYLRITKVDIDRLNGLIRKAHKPAQGLADLSSTERLLDLGVHNKIKELIEAQLIAYLKRLDGRPTAGGCWKGKTSRGNETAHAAARGLLPHRASPSRYSNPSPDMTYSEHQNVIRLARRKFPPPDKSLSREEGYLSRRLKTDKLYPRRPGSTRGTRAHVLSLRVETG